MKYKKEFLIVITCIFHNVINTFVILINVIKMQKYSMNSKLYIKKVT